MRLGWRSWLMAAMVLCIMPQTALGQDSALPTPEATEPPATGASEPTAASTSTPTKSAAKTKSNAEVSKKSASKKGAPKKAAPKPPVKLPDTPQPFTPNTLQVYFSTAKGAGKPIDGDPRAEWNSACSAFAGQFVVGQGPYGYGFANDYVCNPYGKNPEPTQLNQLDLVVRQTKKSVIVRLQWTLQGSRPKVFAKLRFPASNQTFGMLTETNFASLLAMGLLDQVPFAMRLEIDDFGRDGGEILGNLPQGDSDITLPPPPAELHVFDLQWVPKTGLWLPRKLGEANIANPEQKEQKLHSRKKEAEPPRWVVDKLTGSRPKALFAQSVRGLGSYQGAILKIIKKDALGLIKDLAAGLLSQGVAAIGDFFADTAASGYVGLRYGIALLESPFFQKATFVGLLTEIRSGPLDGLRLYIDVWPEIVDPVLDKDLVEEFDLSFKGSRQILGWSFGLNFDWWITRIDLVPKIGRWSISTVAPIIDEGEENPRELVVGQKDFPVDGALSFEIEAGVEAAGSWYILRGWTARSGNISGLGSQSTEVTTNRIGADAIIDGPDFDLFSKEFNFSFLGFFFYEQLEFNALEKEEAEPGEFVINGIKYEQGFGGGGFAISW